MQNNSTLLINNFNFTKVKRKSNEYFNYFLFFTLLRNSQNRTILKEKVYSKTADTFYLKALETNISINYY